MLGYAGPRIAETLDILERDVRLHDPNGARLWIADSKTPTGVRHVEITPSLRDELLAYRADKIRHGYPTGPDTPFFCTRSGKRWDESNVRERILEPAVNLANERLTERGLPPLPVTPHTLRRTYVSIMLLATNFDVTYVQHQVGHAESRMTLDVYAQFLDRRKRDHGIAFDALLADARSALYGPYAEGFGPSFGPLSPTNPDVAPEPTEQNSSFAGTPETRPARFELATFRSGGAWRREEIWTESRLVAGDSWIGAQLAGSGFLPQFAIFARGFWQSCLFGYGETTEPSAPLNAVCAEPPGRRHSITA